MEKRPSKTSSFSGDIVDGFTEDTGGILGNTTGWETNDTSSDASLCTGTTR